MANLGFDWQIDEYMIYCRSRKLREKTMNSYEQALRLFERWCNEQMQIVSVDKVSDAVIRRYINDLQERGKYTFYCNDTMQRKKSTSLNAVGILENLSAFVPLTTISVI